jgi:hypothetical protein
MPTLQSNTHCQAAKTKRSSQFLSISVSFLTHGQKKARMRKSVYMALAGEGVNPRSLRNIMLNEQICASNPHLHIHAKRWQAA